MTALAHFRGPVAKRRHLRRGVVVAEKPGDRYVLVAFAGKGGVDPAAVELAAWRHGSRAAKATGGLPVRTVESYISRGPTWRAGNTLVKAGQWCVGFQLDEPTWNLYKAGTLRPDDFLNLTRKATTMTKAKQTKKLAKARYGTTSRTPTLTHALALMKVEADAAQRDGDTAKAASIRKELATLKFQAGERAYQKAGRVGSHGPNVRALFTSGLSTLPDDPTIRGI